MYTQFFGNYLLSKGCVTQEQLFSAMKEQSNSRLKLGTLAINAGYMTAAEVDQVVIEQTHADRKFGELAVEKGYLTDDQVVELLKNQNPDFLLLGQILVDDGVLTNSDLERLIMDYRTDNELIDLDMTVDSKDNVQKLLKKLLISLEISPSNLGVMYIELLFNNFVRFVGDDFTILSCEECDAIPTECCVTQGVEGPYAVRSYLSMDEPTAVEFASRYVGDHFTQYDEYVTASMEDFLNLHNGLFIVNVSNETSLELSIDAPDTVKDAILDFTKRTFRFSVMYSFGMVNFLLEIDHLLDA
jgi:hypothetical protein